MKTFRINGAVGAILDEYERAIEELQQTIESISEEELIIKVDLETKDEDCTSIQTILTHIISSGYNYAILVRKHFREELDYQPKITYKTVAEYNVELSKMFEYNVALFQSYPNLLDGSSGDKMESRWGQVYDAEQLFEHAIVHVLRHRRQIEIFLMELWS
ncbi:MAG: DinB family protein [Chitinophagales bacterium]